MPTMEWMNTGYVVILMNKKLHPAEQQGLRVEITNHSYEPRTVTAQPILPTSWGMEIAPAETTILPRAAGGFGFSIPIPQHCETFGRVVIPVDITYNARPLGQFREAIFVLTGG